MTDDKRRKTVKEIRKEIEDDERKLKEILDNLEIPEYTDRTLQADWVKSIAGRAIAGKRGWTSLAPQDVVDLLKEGDVYIFETKGFNQVTGWLIDGKWYDRKSDQEIQRQREEWIQQVEGKHKTYVEERREEWTQREEKLPDWLKDQMKIEREASEEFETKPMGWGYTLVACELAAMYAKMGDDILDKNSYSIEDTEEISKFARENGTSGNQHGFALMLAKRHLKNIKENH